MATTNQKAINLGTYGYDIRVQSSRSCHIGQYGGQRKMTPMNEGMQKLDMMCVTRDACVSLKVALDNILEQNRHPKKVGEYATEMWKKKKNRY